MRTLSLLALALLTLAAPLRADGPPWVPLGPGGGQVDSLAVHPTNPNVLYAVTGSRAYKSVNGGASWVQIPGLGNVSQVAFDPFRPTTVYARLSQQILKSVNGGVTWAPAGPDPASTDLLLTLTVDPFRPSRLYLGTWLGLVLQSDDSGLSWRNLGQSLPQPRVGYIRALAVSRPPSQTVFAATRTGLYRTQAPGGLWTRVLGGLPDGEVFTVIVSPSAPRHVYALLGSGIYHSRNGGTSWTRVTTPATSQVNALTVHPRFPTLLLAATEGSGLFRSGDSGLHWTHLGPSATTDARAIAIHSGRARDIYYLGTSPRGLDTGGVKVSLNAGSTWTVRNRGLYELTTVAVAADAGDALLAGTEHHGLFRLANQRGLLWSRTNAGFPPPLSGAVGDVVNAGPGLFFAVTNEALWRSGDAGVSWTRVPGFADNLLAVAANPESVGTAFVMTLQGLFRTLDGGLSWTPLTRPAPDCILQNLVVAPASDAPVLYATGTENLPPCQISGPKVFRSSDGGVSWVNVSAGLPGHYADAVAVDPLDPNVVYVGIGASSIAGPFGLWKSMDGGATWTQTGARPGPVQDVVVSSVPGRVYAVIGFSPRIYRSDDGGATWSPWDEGMPDAVPIDLALDPGDPGRLYAATSRGVWVLEEED